MSKIVSIKTYEELKKKYDGKNISEIESEIDSAQASGIQMKARETEALHYLSKGRFRENQTYKDSTFQTYMLNRFNIRYETYIKNLKAFNWFPKETEKYGVGLVAKVQEKCKEKAETVFKKLDELGDRRKTPVPHKKIEEVIAKHEKPVPPKEPKAPTPTREDVGRQREVIVDLNEVIRQKDEQIKKLKDAVVEKDKIIAELRPYKELYERLAKQLRPIMPMIVEKFETKVGIKEARI